MGFSILPISTITGSGIHVIPEPDLFNLRQGPDPRLENRLSALPSQRPVNSFLPGPLAGAVCDAPGARGICVDSEKCSLGQVLLAPVGVAPRLLLGIEVLGQDHRWQAVIVMDILDLTRMDGMMMGAAMGNPVRQAG